MASSSGVESSGVGASRTMCTGRSVGGVDEGWSRLASAALLFRDEISLFLGTERGVLLILERRGLPLCCWMSVLQISTNFSTVEACLLCSSLLRVERVQSKPSSEYPLDLPFVNDI